MTESINKCRGCIVGSRIHREVYVRFRGEGSETCCRETVRRRILSLQYRANPQIREAHRNHTEPGNLRVNHLAEPVTAKGNLQGQRRYHSRQLRHHAFLGRQGKTTLKEISEILGKGNDRQLQHFRNKGRELSHGLNYQKLGKQLMTEDEIAVMDGGKCILQLRGVRPFFSDKFDITKHPKYKYLSDADPKNAFDMEKHLKRRPAIVKPDEVLTITRLTRQTYRRTQTMRKRSAEEKQKQLERF